MMRIHLTINNCCQYGKPIPCGLWHGSILMDKIYSDLHENIQDKCNENDIEILSPHYRALRDGNMITIPKEYLPEKYIPDAFRVINLKNKSKEK